MGREEFRRLAPAGFAEASPEGRRGFRVVAGTGHEDEAEPVGLRFVAAAERQEDAVLGAEADRGHPGIAGLGRGITRSLVGDGSGDRDSHDLRHAFGTMAADHVRDLVAHDHGEVVVRRREGEHPGMEADLAAGHRERIGGLVIDDRELPAGGRRQDARLVVAPRGGDDLQADLAELRKPRVGRQLLHLRELGRGERCHLAFVDEDELRTARQRDLLAADDRQGRKKQEQAHKKKAQADGEAGPAGSST